MKAALVFSAILATAAAQPSEYHNCISARSRLDLRLLRFDGRFVAGFGR